MRARSNAAASRVSRIGFSSADGSDGGAAGESDLRLRGRGVLNFLALLRHRSPPRRKLPGGNGAWRDSVSSGPSGELASLRGQTTKPSPGASRGRREQAASTRETHYGYLAAHGLQKSYGGRKVVNGVSLYVRRGEAVGLLGPNGAGKTTAFYTITGLIKADRGQIELDGHDVTHLPMYQRARLGIGYLPQEASIFRGLNVEDNIRAVLEVVEPNRRRREADLKALLDEFEIARHRKPNRTAAHDHDTEFSPIISTQASWPVWQRGISALNARIRVSSILRISGCEPGAHSLQSSATATSHAFLSFSRTA